METGPARVRTPCQGSRSLQYRQVHVDSREQSPCPPAAAAAARRATASASCGSAQDAALDAEQEGAEPPDRYLLQFWPSGDASLDRVVREGSRLATSRRSRSPRP